MFCFWYLKVLCTKVRRIWDFRSSVIFVTMSSWFRYSTASVLVTPSMTAARGNTDMGWDSRDLTGRGMAPLNGLLAGPKHVRYFGADGTELSSWSTVNDRRQEINEEEDSVLLKQPTRLPSSCEQFKASVAVAHWFRDEPLCKIALWKSLPPVTK